VKKNARDAFFMLDRAARYAYNNLTEAMVPGKRGDNPMSILHKILESLIPTGGRDLSETEISALRALNVTVPDGSKVQLYWHNGESVSHFMGNVWRPAKRGFKSTHILVSFAAQ
jgi:hypothetical protein